MQTRQMKLQETRCWLYGTYVGAATIAGMLVATALEASGLVYVAIAGAGLAGMAALILMAGKFYR